ncbi:hypothetical protein KJA15_02955 [Patescibacteria group bacterium]|nr:hypothetical protein [Patescibacteria group bacterium]
MNDHLEQIIYNIIGGAAVLVFGWIYSEIKKRYYKCSFKGVFGKDSIDNFILTYGQMRLLPCYDEKGDIRKWPYYHKSGSGFRVSSVVSFAETRSVKYLSETFGKIVHISPKLISDEEIEDKLDISFCSIGGLNNLKTKDVLQNEENVFYDFDASGPEMAIITKKNEEKKFSIDGTYDYAFIIKIIPKNFPNRVWIAVAGLGEWGTSGAAWFLAKNWIKMPKNKSFGMIIKVKGGQDESAEMVDRLF